MTQMAFAYPCLPGGAERLRALAEQIRGSRETEFKDFHRRVGLVSESWYLQQTPQGDVFILILDGDLDRALPAIAASDHPFDRWFTERAREVHGIDFNQPLAAPPPEKLFEG